MEPPRKAPKLSLTEAADIVNQQHSNLGPVHEASSGDQSTAQDHATSAGHDFSQEEEEENAQIQSSLPLYFDHLFGTCIGHSQSQNHSSFHHPGGPILSQSSSIAPFPQCSFGFSVTDTRILDSQGFIFNPSTPSKAAVSAPPPSLSLSSSSLPAQHDQQNVQLGLPACQPSISHPAQNAATLLKSSSSSSSQSPAAIIFSSPSSTSSSPSTRGSNRSGTPVLFPSPSSPIHSARSPEKPVQKFSDTQSRRESLATSADKPVCMSKTSPNQQQDVRGGVFLSQSVRQHLTCTQGSHSSHHVTTCRKRRLNFEAVANCPAQGNRPNYVCPPSCTPLSDCTQIHSKVSIFAVVLQVNPLMEVACRSGSKAGYTVPMSSLLLGDPTKSYFKLSLWREAAAWVERISAGDIILFKNIKLKSWQRETVGTTIMFSSVLNLHQPKKQLPEKVKNVIPLSSLDSLMQWGRRHYSYLFDNPSLHQKSQKIVNFLASGDLGKEALIHFRAKLLSLISDRVVLVADEPGIEIHLYLLSVDATVWHSQLSGGVGQVWEFMFIAVTLDGATQGGGYSLQTTSCSSLRPLQESCQQSTDILMKFSDGGVPESKFISKGCTIASVTSTRTSGIIEIEARATTAWFLLCDGTRLDLSQVLQEASEEIISLLCQAVYVGCESCSRPLQQDVNGVYCQCLPCMLKKPGGYPSSTYYFRPMLISLQDSTGDMVVLVTYTVIPKVVGVSAAQIVEANLSEKFGGMSGAVKESWRQLLRSCDQQSRDQVQVGSLATGTKWIINCTVSKDENSFLEAVCFSLLDVK